MTVRIQMENAASFAEVAETVGVESTDVMAVAPVSATMLGVMYSTETLSERPRMWRAFLRRQTGGYAIVGGPTEIPNAFADLKTAIETGLAERFDV